MAPGVTTLGPAHMLSRPQNLRGNNAAKNLRALLF
jgi:hypothetical protein